MFLIFAGSEMNYFGSRTFTMLSLIFLTTPFVSGDNFTVSAMLVMLIGNDD